MNVFKFVRNLTLGVLALSLAAGCSSGSSGKDPAAGNPSTETPKKTEAPNNDPVTISFYSGLSEKLFKDTVSDPITKKYPNFTIQQVLPKSNVTLQDMVTSGTLPDILDGQNLFTLSQLQAAEDLTPLLKKYKFDVNVFEDRIADAVKKSYYFDGKLTALPYTVNVATLHYNKDLFSRFGVAFPKDGMTWDEVIALAKTMTRLDGGVQFRGLDLQLTSVMLKNQLSLPVVDQAAEKAAVNTDGWKRWFNKMKAVYEIEGNRLDSNQWGWGTDPFLKEKNVAMIAVSTMFSALPDAEKAGLNWDVVTLPSFEDIPNTTIYPNMPNLVISSQSKHKEEAFRAILQLLSEEVQLANTKLGRPTVLKNPEIYKQFGVEVEVLKGKGKNTQAFYKHKWAPLPNSNTRYDSRAYSVLQAKFKQVAFGQKDVNTALREAEEDINKIIAEEKGK